MPHDLLCVPATGMGYHSDVLNLLAFSPRSDWSAAFRRFEATFKDCVSTVQTLVHLRQEDFYSMDEIVLSLVNHCCWDPGAMARTWLPEEEEEEDCLGLSLTVRLPV